MARMQEVDASALKKPILGGANGSGNASTSAAGSSAPVVASDITEIGPPGITEDGARWNRKSNWRLIGLATFFLFYLAFGASVFSAIEGPIETAERNELIRKKQEFMSKHQTLTEDELEDFIGEIVYANDRGVSILKSGTSVPSWSFGQAFFFSSTVVTTIGYGHQSPLSSEGKVFCILYALIGIPMTLILLTAVVERLLIPVLYVRLWLQNRIGHLYQPMVIYVGHFLVLAMLVVCVFFLVPALIFAKLEASWGFLDSLYYCFISLTTIGLGDFIPGDSPGQALRPLYKACTTFYLLLGVTAMMLTLSVFYNIPQCDLNLFFLLRRGATSRATSGGCCGLGDNESDGTDPERIRLQTAGGRTGPKYTQHLDEPDGQQRRIVRARSRPCEDSPSPVDEDSPIPGPSTSSGRRH